MTLHPSFESYVIKHTVSYIERYRKQLDKYRLYGTPPSGLSEKIVYANKLAADLPVLERFIIDDCVVDILDEIKQGFNPSFKEHSDKITSLESRRSAAIKQVLARKDSLIKAKESEIESRRKELLDSMGDLISKHSKLMSMKPELDNLFRIYGLSTSSVRVDYGNASFEELKELLDISLLACQATIKEKGILKKAVSIIYLPATKELDDKDTDKVFRISWAVGLLIAGVFGKPYLLGTVGLIYIINMFGNIYKVYEKEELLKLAYSLTSEMDFNRFIDQDEKYNDLKRELADLQTMDLSEETNSIHESFDKELSDLEVINPEKEYNKIKIEYARSLEEIESECRLAEKEVMSDLKQVITSYRIELELLKEGFREQKKNLTRLGSSISESKTLSRKFKLGVAQFDGEIIAEASAELPLSNIVFTYKNEKEREQQTDFIKLLLTNTIANIKEKRLKVTIFDALEMGVNFLEFNRLTTQDILEVKNTEFAKTLEESLTLAKRNSVKFGVQTIDDFNIEAEKVGRVTVDYNLLIIASTEEEVHNNKRLKAFLDYSAKQGCWIWLVGKDESLFDPRMRDDVSKFYSGLPRSDEAGIINYPGITAIGGYRDPITPYTYDPAMGIEVMDSLEKAIEENRIDSIDYEEGFRKLVIPDEKIWTYSTRKGIELRLGYMDGDPSKPLTVQLGDRPVHALGGGMTGAGKSAWIDQMIASLMHMYSPEELEMVMIDFKNVEFMKYTGDYLIPHARVIAGTKDGEYAISIFDYLIEEMDRRIEMFGEYQFQNIEQYNDLMERLGKPILPRVLLLIDEYQVMFTEVDDKSLEIIKKRITSLSKLARFAGCHMLFISQSMKGTMSDDIMDQFALRLALKCSVDTSTSLLGNRAAADIKEKLGYMYSNDSGGANPLANRLWRIPYASNSYIKEYMPRIIERVARERRIHRRADFYDDKKFHEGEEIQQYFDDERFDMAGKPKTFILGETTQFSLNRMPPYMTFTKQLGENVLITGYERMPLLNLLNTFIKNFENKEGVTWGAYSGDKDYTSLLDLANRVPENQKALITGEWEEIEILNMLENKISKRESGEQSSETPYYFMAIAWDNLPIMGRTDYHNLSEPLKSILQRAGAVGIHIIFVLKETKQFKQFKPLINHKIVAFCEEMESLNWLDSPKANRIPENTDKFAYYRYANDQTKFKIYQFPVTGEIESREVEVIF